MLKDLIVLDLLQVLDIHIFGVLQLHLESFDVSFGLCGEIPLSLFELPGLGLSISKLLLKLGDFVVGSQELLVACGLDHVVVVRNLLQLGLRGGELSDLSLSFLHRELLLFQHVQERSVLFRQDSNLLIALVDLCSRDVALLLGLCELLLKLPKVRLDLQALLLPLCDRREGFVALFFHAIQGFRGIFILFLEETDIVIPEVLMLLVSLWLLPRMCSS
mmetsp:Transcript_53565/g.117095  ORF Transcript_53565/g.117095 Transcript_53565/m.117095 type:complete len:218 (+) Transcript_53565:1803-2456(+)